MINPFCFVSLQQGPRFCCAAGQVLFGIMAEGGASPRHAEDIDTAMRQSGAYPKARATVRKSVTWNPDPPSERVDDATKP